MKNAFALFTVSLLLFSCGGGAEPETTEGEGVSTEVSEKLETEQELNNQVHELHDDLDDMLETL